MEVGVCPDTCTKNSLQIRRIGFVRLTQQILAAPESCDRHSLNSATARDLRPPHARVVAALAETVVYAHSVLVQVNYHPVKLKPA